MHTQDDATTPAPNAFTSEYLQLMNQRDEPVTSTAADVAGPWHLEPHPLEEGWAVQRQGASLTSSPAYASFKHKDAARLAWNKCQPFRPVPPTPRPASPSEMLTPLFRPCHHLGV